MARRKIFHRGFIDRITPYVAVAVIVLSFGYADDQNHQARSFASQAAASSSVAATASANAAHYAKLDHQLQKRAIVEQNRHHTQTSNQNKAIELALFSELTVLNQHTQTLNEAAATDADVAALQKEFTLFLQEAEPAIASGQATLTTKLNVLGAQIQAVCAATHAACTG